MDHTAHSASLNSETTQSSRLRCARVPLYEHRSTHDEANTWHKGRYILAEDAGSSISTGKILIRKSHSQTSSPCSPGGFAKNLGQVYRTSARSQSRTARWNPMARTEAIAVLDAPVEYKRFRSHESLCKWVSTMVRK